MTESQTVTVSASFKREELCARPHLCPPEQFKVFCDALDHVQTNPKDKTPLHASIREVLDEFSILGDSTVDELKDNLRHIAESAHLLTGNQLARGNMSYEWSMFVVETEVDTKKNASNTNVPEGEFIEDNDTDLPWIGFFARGCFGYQKSIVTYPLEMEEILIRPAGKPRLLEFMQWAENTREAGNSMLKSMNLPVPEVTVELKVFPKLHLQLRCTQVELEGAMVEFNIFSTEQDTIVLDVTWDTGNGAPLLDFGIPHCIAEANRIDEALVRGKDDAKPAYRLKLNARGESIAA